MEAGDPDSRPMFGLWSIMSVVLGAGNYGLTLITTVDLTVVSVVTVGVWQILRTSLWFLSMCGGSCENMIQPPGDPEQDRGAVRLRRGSSWRLACTPSVTPGLSGPLTGEWLGKPSRNSFLFPLRCVLNS